MPQLHYAVALDWPGRSTPPALDRHGFLTLEDLAMCDPPWCAAWEAVDQWRSLGYLVLPDTRERLQAET